MPRRERETKSEAESGDDVEKDAEGRGEANERGGQAKTNHLRTAGLMASGAHRDRTAAFGVRIPPGAAGAGLLPLEGRMPCRGLRFAADWRRRRRAQRGSDGR